MGSELINRRHESQPPSDGYSPKPPKPWIAVSGPFRYVLREQRLLFVLLGMAIATLVFSFTPSAPAHVSNHAVIRTDFTAAASTESLTHRFSLPSHGLNPGGKIPLGLKRKGLRIVVTGGAGFVGSHLVDRLIGRGDSVIVVDNFFTGRKENVMHHFRNPRFELIRHDVVEPLLLEVDQIYHLACPASPVHCKFNPVKTIKTNVVGTLNMLGLAKRVGARFLLTSTSEVYGDPLQHPQVETYWGNVNPIDNRREKSLGLLTKNCQTIPVYKYLVSLDEAARLLLGDSPNSSQMRNICDTTSTAEFELKLGGFHLYVARELNGKNNPPIPPSLSPVITNAAPEDVGSNGSVVSPTLAITKSKPSIGGIQRLLDTTIDEGLAILQSPKVGYVRRSKTIKGKRAPPPCKEFWKSGNIPSSYSSRGQYYKDDSVRSWAQRDHFQKSSKHGKHFCY